MGPQMAQSSSLEKRERAIPAMRPATRESDRRFDRDLPRESRNERNEPSTELMEYGRRPRFDAFAFQPQRRRQADSDSDTWQ